MLQKLKVLNAYYRFLLYIILLSFRCGVKINHPNEYSLNAVIVFCNYNKIKIKINDITKDNYTFHEVT